MMTKNERTPGSAIGAVWRNLGIASLVILFLAVCVIAAIAVYIPQNTADAVAQRGEVVLEASTGRVLYSDNMNAVTYPASTTKILTALVVLEHLPLGYKVKIPACAAGVEGSSIYLRKGEVLTVEDLLYGLMLRSGNDAAVALACAVAGNVENFAELMNARPLHDGVRPCADYGGSVRKRRFQTYSGDPFRDRGGGGKQKVFHQQKQVAHPL